MEALQKLFKYLERYTPDISVPILKAATEEVERDYLSKRYNFSAEMAQTPHMSKDPRTQGQVVVGWNMISPLDGFRQFNGELLARDSRLTGMREAQIALDFTKFFVKHGYMTADLQLAPKSIEILEKAQARLVANDGKPAKVSHSKRMPAAS